MCWIKNRNQSRCVKICMEVCFPYFINYTRSGENELRSKLLIMCHLQAYFVFVKAL